MCDRSQNCEFSLYSRRHRLFFFFFVFVSHVCKIKPFIRIFTRMFSFVFLPPSHQIVQCLLFSFRNPFHLAYEKETRHILKRDSDQSSLALHFLFKRLYMRCVYNIFYFRYLFSLSFSAFYMCWRGLHAKMFICVNKLSPNGVRVNSSRSPSHTHRHRRGYITNGFCNCKFSFNVRQKCIVGNTIERTCKESMATIHGKNEIIQSVESIESIERRFFGSVLFDFLGECYVVCGYIRCYHKTTFSSIAIQFDSEGFCPHRENETI